MIGQRLVDRYRILDEIGRGGMATVYSAWDLTLDREIALKLVDRHRADSNEASERFLREAKIVARLQHPNIVSIYDFGSTEDWHFLVMPRLAGHTLRERLEQGRPSIAETLQIAYQLAEALGFSHTQGIVHRDVKPANVMLEPGTGGLQVRLMDFGIAWRPESPGLTEKNQILGTLLYASPEQVQGLPIDHRADLYSFGAMLFEMLWGRPPFSGSTLRLIFQIVSQEPEWPTWDGSVPECLQQLLVRCLAKEPSARPDSVEEICRCLEETVSKPVSPASVLAPAVSLQSVRERTEITDLLTAGGARSQEEKRLQDRDEGERFLLEALWIAEGPVTLAMLEELAGGEAVGTLDRLAYDGLVLFDGDRVGLVDAAVADELEASLALPRRRLLHRRLAEVCARDSVDPALARSAAIHFQKAGQLDRALASGLQAARADYRADRLEDVIELASRILPDDDPAPASELASDFASLMLVGARARYDSGDREGALLWAQRVGCLASSDEQRLETAVLTAEAAWHVRAHEEAMKAVEWGLRIARSIQADEALLRLLRVGQELGHFRGDIERAEAWALEAEIIERRDLGEDSTELVADLADHWAMQSEYGEAERAYEQALRVASGPGPERIRLQIRLGRLALQSGRYDEAREHCRRAFRAAGTAEPTSAAVAAAFLGMIERSVGDLEAGQRWVRRGWELVESLPSGERRPAAVAMLARTEGNLAMDRGQPRAAVSSFRRSLEACPRSDVWEWSIALFNLADALVEAGERDEAEVCLQRAEESKVAIGDRWGLAHVQLCRARLLLEARDLVAARRSLGQALESAGMVEDPKLGAAIDLVRAWAARLERDEAGARAHYRGALRRAESAGLRAEARRARIGLAALDFEIGRFRQARGEAVEAIAEVASAIDHADGILVLAGVAAADGRYEEAQEHLTAALELCEQVGHPHRLAVVLGRLATLQLVRGLPSEARPLLERLSELARSTGSETLEGQALSGFAEAHFLAGLGAEAVAAAERAIDAFRSLGDQRLEAAMEELLARCLLESAELDRAKQRALRAIELLGAQGDRYCRDLGRSYLVLGQIHHSAAEVEAGNEAFVQARFHLARCGDGAAVGEGYRAIARTLARNRPENALRLLERAAEKGRNAGQPLVEAEARGDRGELMQRLGRLPEALDDYSREEQALDKIEYRRGMSRNAFHFASVYGLMGRFSEAVSFVTTCLELAEAVGNLGRLHGLEQRARMYLELGRWQEAESDLEQAFELADRHRLAERRASLELVRTQLEWRYGRLDSAREHLRSGQASVGSLPEEETAQGSGTELRNRFDLLDTALRLEVGDQVTAAATAARVASAFDTLSAPIEASRARLLQARAVGAGNGGTRLARRVARWAEDSGCRPMAVEAHALSAELGRDPGAARQAAELAREIGGPWYAAAGLGARHLCGDLSILDELRELLDEASIDLPAALRRQALEAWRRRYQLE